MTTGNGVIKGSDQSRGAETALCIIPVSAESTCPEELSQAVSSESDSEFPNVSPQHAPGSRNRGSIGNSSPAVLDAMVPKAPIQTSCDALDEAIEEVAAFKDLV